MCLAFAADTSLLHTVLEQKDLKLFSNIIFFNSSTLKLRPLQAYEKTSVTTYQPTGLNALENLNFQI